MKDNFAVLRITVPELELIKHTIIKEHSECFLQGQNTKAKQLFTLLTKIRYTSLGVKK